ncbi:unnamed protein product, partial [Prorocentrum cordatum]
AFRNAFKASNQHISEDRGGALEDLILSLDADGTGKIEYTEWLAATMKDRRAPPRRRRCRRSSSSWTWTTRGASRAPSCARCWETRRPRRCWRSSCRAGTGPPPARPVTPRARGRTGVAPTTTARSATATTEDDESSDEDDEGNSIGFEDFKKLITRVAAARLQE